MSDSPMAASSSSSEVSTVRLRGSDGKAVEVPEKAIAAASVTIKGILDQGCAAGEIEIPRLTAATLSRVVEYVKKHFGSGAATADDDSSFALNDDFPLARFDDKFVSVDNESLVDLIEAAEYLNIDKLLDLTCKAVAEQMKGKTVDQIRKRFNIVNDYTQEEEEEVLRENSWAFSTEPRS